MSGLEHGIVDNSDDVVNAMGDVGTSLIEHFRNVVGVHSDSTEAAEIGGFFDSGLWHSIRDHSGPILDTVKNLGNSVMDTLGFSLDGFGLGENFMNQFNLGLESGGHAMSDDAQKLYDKAVLRLLDTMPVGSTYADAEALLAKQTVASQAAAYETAQAKAGYMTTKEKSIAASIISKLDSSATWKDAVNALKNSGLFNDKEIEEYVETLKKSSDKAEEIVDNVTETVDPLQEALNRAKELSSKFSEAKKTFDEYYQLLQDGFLDPDDFVSLYKTLLSEYAE